jgi:hypothetical protein
MFKSLCSILLNAPVDKIIDKADNKPQPRSSQESKTSKPADNPSQVIASEQKNKSTVLTKQPKGPERIKQRNCC